MSNQCKTLSILAIVLWLAGAGFVGFRMIRGNVSGVEDGRVVIQIKPEERDFVLTEMRMLLSSIQGISSGLAEQNTDRIIEAAQMSGMKMAADVNPALMMKLPMDFKTKGMEVHSEFDAFALEMGKDPRPEKAIQFLDAQLKRCVACHSSYKLVPEK